MMIFQNTKSVFLLCVLFSPSVQGSGFQLWDQNASGNGNYYAGSVSEAKDASTVFYNPAGITYLNKHALSFGFNYVVPYIKFKGNVGVSTGRVSASDFTADNVKYSPARSHTAVIIPNIYYATPINESWYAGIGINAPFGTRLKYSQKSFVRYTGTVTDIRIVNISPVLAVRLSPSLSFGAGLDIQKMEEELKTNLNAVAGNSASETYSVNRLSSISPGFHAGIMYQLSPKTRLGISYHSPVKHNLQGKSKFFGPLVSTLEKNKSDCISTKKIRTGTVLPAYTTISLFHKMKKWDLMGSLSYTMWDRVKHFRLYNMAGIDINTNLSKSITVTVPASLHNTWNTALGANYHINRQFYVQFGLGYDKSPVRLTGRSTRFPDGDRYAFSSGFHYKINQAWDMDAGWTHLLMAKKSKVQSIQQVGAMSAYTNGHVAGHMNIIGVQLSCYL